MKNNKNKGQFSMEFLLIIGVIFIIFIVITVFSFERKKDVAETENYLNAIDECEKISGMISEIYINGDGSQIEAKTDFLISLSNESKILVQDTENKINISCPFYAVSSVDEFSGNFLIKNENNIILIENVTSV